LWESWRDTEGTEILTFTIITTDANTLVKPIHDRMPVIMDTAQAQSWIDPKCPSQEVQALLKPYPAQEMTAYPVSPKVNSPSCDTPDCTLAVVPQVQEELF
jgi:putative SOS response-associated peptidase YedK